uniref:Uncharacterized protein n=1 Tax=Schistocephalus solidus TaxID=70667 RepID=A0A0V0JB12_SCHSO
MALSAKCREFLSEFECACREKKLIFEGLSQKLDNICLADGEVVLLVYHKVFSQMPNELQRIEILDALAMHFTSSCDEETSRTAFHLLFPYGPNISPLRENFLILLVELALCLGLAPILDLAAIRLKVSSFTSSNCMTCMLISVSVRTVVHINFCPACKK